MLESCAVQDDVFGIAGSVQDGVFRVKQQVAEGGFAVVYRAHHEGFRADVALKCLKIPGTLSHAKQTEFLEKFRAEGELLFRLSAAIPAVVRPLQLGTVTSPRVQFVPFIALEWLEGENLDTFIVQRKSQGKQPLQLARAVALLAPAARALEQAHHFPGPEGQVAILHRDLKPENLFVADVHGREAIKVLDFGIGKVKRAATQMVGHASIDDSSFAAFTPAYGAPEQWLPKRFGQTGTWTDVWGFALTVVELLTQEPPLDGDAHAVMGAAMDESQRPTPRTFGIATSDTVEAIFRKALAVDPRDRYHDIGEFWDHLENELGLQNTRATARLGSFESVPPQGVGRRNPAPRLERAHGDEEVTLLDLNIPDLDERPRASGRSKPSGRKHSPAPSSSIGDYDEFAEDAGVGTGGELIPNIGGFRLDSPSQASAGGSLDLATSAAELRAKPAPAKHVPIVAPHQRSLLSSVAGPMKLLMVAAIITALDFGYTVQTGEIFHIGPARAFWIAAPLSVLAIVKMVFRLVDH
jgi:serine/threonine-protein kinase